MHEGSLTQNLFEHILAHAEQARARRVSRVKVAISMLSDATPESIEFYFSQLTPGTIVEGAALEFESQPGTAKCPACDEEFEINDIYSACPKCNKFPITVTSGNGVYLSSLEIETHNEKSEHIHE